MHRWARKCFVSNPKRHQSFGYRYYQQQQKCFSTALAHSFSDYDDADESRLQELTKRQMKKYLKQLGSNRYSKLNRVELREKLRLALDQNEVTLQELGLQLSAYDDEGDDYDETLYDTNDENDYIDDEEDDLENNHHELSQDEDRYNNSTVSVLKEELRKRNLAVSGRKLILIQRLQNHDQQQQKSSESEAVSTTEEEAIEDLESEIAELSQDEVSSWTVQTYRDLLRTNNLKVSGTKCDLMIRWRNFLRDHATNSDSETTSQPPPPPIDLTTVKDPVMCVFDKANSYKLMPLETMQKEEREQDALLSPRLEIPDEVDSLLALLPPHLRKQSPLLSSSSSLNKEHAATETNNIKSNLIEIVLDLGRRPVCWLVGGKRRFLLPTQNEQAQQQQRREEAIESENSDVNDDDDQLDEEAMPAPEIFGSSTEALEPVTDAKVTDLTSSANSISSREADKDAYLVTKEDLKHVLGGLRFGQDNRAGIERCLHRISGVRNRDGELVGATLRVGRYVPGNAILIADLLYNTNASILFVGPPGSAKTSILRDAARILSEQSEQNVVIVDTSCEIGGAGDIPHACVGLSRRMQVATIESQAKTMVECVQNHTPGVIVIDEIGRSAEVKAALTCKERGVRIMASAHGSLPGLVRNAELCELVGGVDVVTIGDKTAQKQRTSGGSGSKLKAERKGPPVFDIVVELQRGQLHEWGVVLSTKAAVDNILAYGKYSSQVRRRHPKGQEAGIAIKNIVLQAERDEIVEEQRQTSGLLPSPMARTHTEVFNPENFDWALYTSGIKADRKPLTMCPVCTKTLRTNKGMMNHVLNMPCKHKVPEDVLAFFRRNKK